MSVIILDTQCAKYICVAFEIVNGDSKDCLLALNLLADKNVVNVCVKAMPLKAGQRSYVIPKSWQPEKFL